ncbi:hypothetical protein H1S01_09845 [Heliobacterium chlorum]|uniref:Zinc ribbon domain-containing protein n=1 Tax=Heliobacterium chlorum TaxID=2698 RepID=A0ABR7T206_HELCL|nr:hypothetical protein [Heliobacterium chlorum]MBC9784813.1 hypothetical protein [Heliobacterium chlorum]
MVLKGLTTCKVCHQDVAAKEKTCPRCGTTLRWRWVKKIVIGIGGFLVFIMCTGVFGDSMEKSISNIHSTRLSSSTPTVEFIGNPREEASRVDSGDLLSVMYVWRNLGISKAKSDIF